jgi:hypothetical protein
MFNYADKFPGLVLGTFPNITGKNASGPSATDGTPFTADYISDHWGWMQALLHEEGITPNGQAEAAGSSQIMEAFRRGAALPPGLVIHSAVQNPVAVASMRLLHLAGQVADISPSSPYYRMGVAVYCGDDKNATAQAFYKCADASGNTRSTSGAYMKLPDCRGLFLRGAGINGQYTAANDTPYDGGAIGAFMGDTIRNIIGHSALSSILGVWHDTDLATFLSGFSGALSAINTATVGLELSPSAQQRLAWRLAIDASLAVPTSYENRPASISAAAYMTY